MNARGRDLRRFVFQLEGRLIKGGDCCWHEAVNPEERVANGLPPFRLTGLETRERWVQELELT